MPPPTPFHDYKKPAKAQPVAPMNRPVAGLLSAPFGVLPVGTLLEDTEPNRAQLAQRGWAPTSEVAPMRVQSRDEAVRKIRKAAAEPVVPLNKPPLKVPVTPIEDLPPAEQAKHRAAIAAMQAQAGPVPYIPGAGPGVNESLATVQELPEEEPDQVSSNPDKEDPKTPPADTTGNGLPPASCPNCGWKHDRVDLVAVDDHDKYAYLAMIHGGSEVRFEKEFSLFGGALKVRFRTRSRAEECLAAHQLAADLRSGREPAVNTPYGQLTKLLDYRLALSLVSVARHGEATEQMPKIDVAIPPVGQDTELVRLNEWIYDEVLGSPSIQRAVATAFIRFINLEERLEVNAENPDFWSGIDAPR